MKKILVSSTPCMMNSHRVICSYWPIDKTPSFSTLIFFLEFFKYLFFFPKFQNFFFCFFKIIHSICLVFNIFKLICRQDFKILLSILWKPLFPNVSICFHFVTYSFSTRQSFQLQFQVCLLASNQQSGFLLIWENA